MKVLEHKGFFVGVVVLFILQAVWIAVTAAYPLLFDEYYHVGVIDAYRGISPFIVQQPPETAIYGDITRYGSYLYHYLLSFPYRLTGALTGDFVSQVIVLRLISIAMVAASLYFFRRTLLAIGISRAITHVALALFTLIPIVPYLAAHVNYDTLLILGVSVFLYFGVRIVQSQGNLVLNSSGFVITGLLTSLVKFAFLPILLASAIFIVALLFKRRAQVFVGTERHIAGLSVWKRVIIAMLLLISAGLFIERFGVNLIRYGSPEAACEKVHSIPHCLSYGPWARNYLLKQKDPSPSPNPVAYTAQYWLPMMVDNLLISGSARNDGEKVTVERPDFKGTKGVPLLHGATWTFYWVGLGALLLVGWTFMRRRAYLFIAVAIVSYLGLLWARNFVEYLQLGQPVAVQARYALPVLVFIIAFALQAISRLVRIRALKLGMLLVTILVSTQGGGFITYMLVADADTHWRRSPLVPLSERIQKVLRRVVIR